MILAAVGTYMHGFDELVEAFDEACHNLELDGFAQIGHSRHLPCHVAYERFIPHGDLKTMMGHARLVVCHAGMGIVGDAMRSGAEIIMMPRRAQLNADEPTNDQLPFAEATSERYGLGLCTDPGSLEAAMKLHLRHTRERKSYRIESNVNYLVARSLRLSSPDKRQSG
jgi:UDP-N-acetylglucosamine transferase subunit ALG13